MKKQNSIMFVIILCFMMLTPAYARAGGGSSGGGGTGGSGGSGGSTHSSSNTSRASTPAEFLVQLAPVGILLCGGSIPLVVHRYRIYKKSRLSKRLLKDLKTSDAFWDEDYLQQQIEVIFYTAQTCWADKNMEALREYLSKELYENWRMKQDWMEVRHERNVLKRIKLLSSQIVGVYDSKIDEHDMFWVAIRGKMVDYTISEEDGSIVDGSKVSQVFLEYWKFVREQDSFLLDEVRQRDEVDVDVFLNFSEEQEYVRDGRGLWHP